MLSDQNQDGSKRVNGDGEYIERTDLDVENSANADTVVAL
jgi:hypothetical protein